MTAEIINLRRARKAKARQTAEAQAAENRVRFGRSKADREHAAREAELAERRIDGARRDTDVSGTGVGNDVLSDGDVIDTGVIAGVRDAVVSDDEKR